MNTALDHGARRWTVLCAFAAVLPLALVLPPAVQALLLLCFAVGSASALSGRLLPRPLRILLALLALAAVLWQFGAGSLRMVSRDTGSALLAVMLGMKLLETSTLRDARSAVVFGLFAVMAAFLQDQGPTTLLLALAAGLLTLAGLARLAAMETPTSSEQALEAETPPRRLRAAGLLLIYSLPLAAAGFFLFPRLAQPLWGLPQNSEAGRTGLSEDMSPGDIASLFVDDPPVLRVSFEGATPPAPQRYFRGPVLHAFDGRRWTRGYVSNNTPPSPEPGATTLTYSVEQEPTDRRYLFALDLPLEAPGDGRFDYGRALTVERPQSKLRRERYRSSPDYRLEPELTRTLQRLLSDLPEGFNPRTLALAQRWRAEHGSAEAVIDAALRWFNQSFTYTLEPPLLGRDSVDDFLFESQRGYCEHFSSAFTVLMRAAGFPARVVTGYQGGQVNPMGDYLVVRQSDAHAWAEVWIAGRGWVRVDPTNAVSPERIEQGAQSLRENSAWREVSAPLRDAVDWLRRGWNDWVLGYGAAQQQRLLRPFGVDQADWRQLGLALIVTAGIALAITLVLLLRRPADTEPPMERAWRRLRWRLQRAGFDCPASLPPRSLAERLKTLPELQALCRRYSHWAYAANPDDKDAAELLAALRRARVPRQRQG
jgi:transglutaminase-like putative cysteine protease